MSKCQNLDKCNFFKVYQDQKKRALKGFVQLYCQGDNQNKCVRKIISKTLGDSEFVPSNMMPNGLPLVGTNDLGWTSDVKEMVQNYIRTS